MGRLRFFLSFFFIFISLTLLAKEVVPSKTATSSAIYLSDLRKRLQDQEKSVGKLTGNMMQLEKEIGKGNERYMKVLQKRRDVENGLFDIKNTLKKYEQELTEKQLKANKLLAVAVMSSLDKNEDAALLLSRKFAIENLKKDLGEIKSLWERNKELTAQMEEFKVRYEEYLTVETELATLLNNIEAQKREVQENYQEELERKNLLKQKVDHLSTVAQNAPKPKVTATPNSKIAVPAVTVSKEVIMPAVSVEGLFSSPLKVVEKIEAQRRGEVLLKFKESQAVLAPRDGKVMHSGELSTYGNVVVIDHGQEIISVVFGPFLPKPQRGTQVKAGDVIGQVSSKKIGNGSIYFAVRKKNTVQDTIKLLDQKTLSIKAKS